MLRTSASIATTLIVLASLLTATPSLAAKNAGTAKFNAAAHRQLCADLKTILDTAQTEADMHSGTKAAATYSDTADKAWNDGAKQKCNWAK